MVVPVQVFERLRRNVVETPLALIGDGSLQPVLLNPKDNPRFADMQRACEAFYGKPIAPYIAQAGQLGKG